MTPPPIYALQCTTVTSILKVAGSPEVHKNIKKAARAGKKVPAIDLESVRIIRKDLVKFACSRTLLEIEGTHMQHAWDTSEKDLPENAFKTARYDVIQIELADFPKKPSIADELLP